MRDGIKEISDGRHIVAAKNSGNPLLSLGVVDTKSRETLAQSVSECVRTIVKYSEDKHIFFQKHS